MHATFDDAIVTPAAGRQWFGSFSQSEKPNVPPSDCDYLAPARDSSCFK
jgi:hypothetical protein